MRQYRPKKPVKCGFKVWMLSDSHNGYVSSFEVYTGKKVIQSKGGYEQVLSRHSDSPYNTGIFVIIQVTHI